jgi:hypothetical protein
VDARREDNRHQYITERRQQTKTSLHGRVVILLSSVRSSFTNAGHLVALIIGMSLSVRFRVVARWTPVRRALLTIGAPSGPSWTAITSDGSGALPLSWNGVQPAVDLATLSPQADLAPESPIR